MTKNSSRSIGGRVKSIGYALNGLKLLVRTEPNALIHLIATIAVITAGYVCKLDRVEWVAISVAIGIVWIAEGFNTCIELLCDMYNGEEYNEKVKVIKDISAAAVLIASIVSVVIGLVIFLPLI